MSKKVRKIRKNMQEIFNTYKYDWLGEEITENNPLTYHHIVKVVDGGRTTLSNGALLTNSIHILVHQTEYLDLNLYLELKYWFEIINKLNRPLSDELIQIMIILKERMIIASNHHKKIKKMKYD